MRFLALHIFCFMLCFCFVSCDFVYRLLDKEGAEEKELVGEAVPFKENLTVKEIQTLLKIYGYSPGEIDGIIGPKTRDAISRFQKNNQLKVIHFVDQQTWTKLKKFKDNGFVKDGQINIRLVQEHLTKTGFSPGKIDREMGLQTKEAIIIFQREYELKVDGKLGYDTLTKLSALLAVK